LFKIYVRAQITISEVQSVPPGLPYISFFILGVMLRVHIALHLSVAHDDITRHLANCDENYKFIAYPYSIL